MLEKKQKEKDANQPYQRANRKSQEDSDDDQLD